MQGHPGYVYFLQDKLIPESPIKIGWSNDPERRCRAINLGLKEPRLSLIAWFPGSMDEERALHRRFARWHVNGEWFRPAPEILQAAQLCRLLHCGASA